MNALLPIQRLGGQEGARCMLRALWRAVLVAVLVATATSGTLPVASAAVPPGTPHILKITSTIEGVELVWSAADYQAGQPTPTSWEVRRSADGQDRVWTLANTAGLGSVTLRDDDITSGVTAGYTVVALADGLASAPSDVVQGVRVSDPGPFDQARTALTVTWDREDHTHRSGALLDTSGNPPVVTPVFTGVGLSDQPYGGGSWYVAVPWPIQDGAYLVGTQAGAVEVIARAGAGCNAPSGSLTVKHAAPTRTGYWKSLTLDADLTCDDGFTLKVQGRIASPDPVSAVAADGITTVPAAAGTSSTRLVEVRNTGSSPVALGGERILWSGESDPAGVMTVTGSTCRDVVLAAGASCTVTVEQSRPAGAGAWLRYLGRLVVQTSHGEVGVGTVMGTAPEELMGPQAVIAQGRPGVSQFSWTNGGENGHSTYAVVDEGDRVLGSGISSPIVVSGLAPGEHHVRIRQTVSDGRVYTSPARRMLVPKDWVFASSATGVRAYGITSDAAAADGLVVAEWPPARMTAVVLEASPNRKEVIATDRYEPRVFTFNDRTIVNQWAAGVRLDRPRPRPDGAVTAFQRSSVTQGETSLQSPAILLRERTSGVVTEVPGSAAYYLQGWTPDGAALLVVPTDGQGLRRMNPTTGATTAVAGASDVVDASVSRSGRLAVLRTGGWTLWEMPLGGGALTSLGIYAYGNEFSWDVTGTKLLLGSQAWSTGSTGAIWDLSTSTPTKVRDLPQSTSITWWDPESSAPQPKVTVPAWTTASPTLTLSATDPDDAPGGITSTCKLDAATTWSPCAGALKFTGLSAGSHTVTVRATDPSGMTGETSATWRVDAASPTTSVTTLATATLTTSIPLTWSASDTGGSGIARYDVRYRRAPTSSGLGAYTYPTSLQGTTSRSAAFAVSAGYQYCISARSRDLAGNIGAWSAERCTAVALDDRSLTASRGWSRGTSTSYVYNTYSRAATSKATLTKTGVSARRVGLVVTTCSTCGSLDVWVGATYAGRVSLVSSTTRAKQVKWLPTFTSNRSGTLTVRTVTSKASFLDAVLVSH